MREEKSILKKKKKKKERGNKKMKIKDYTQKKKLEKKIEIATNKLDFASAIYFDKLLQMLKQQKNVDERFLGGIK